MFLAYNSMCYEFDHLLGGRETLSEAIDLAMLHLTKYTDARVVEVPNTAFDPGDMKTVWSLAGYKKDKTHNHT